MILVQYLGGNKVHLYFHETDDYKRIESALLGRTKPPFNGARVHTALPTQFRKQSAVHRYYKYSTAKQRQGCLLKAIKKQWAEDLCLPKP